MPWTCSSREPSSGDSACSLIIDLVVVGSGLADGWSAIRQLGTAAAGMLLRVRQPPHQSARSSQTGAIGASPCVREFRCLSLVKCQPLSANCYR